LVSGDGHHVGLLGADSADIFLLRQSRSGFARDNLTEIAGMRREPKTIETWPGARCNVDACIVTLQREERTWRVLLTRSRNAAAERALAAVCERVDIVISERWLPRSCHPRWLKADRRLLERTGGLAIDLSGPSLTTVAQGEGHHGWWRETSAKRQGSALAGARATAPTRAGTGARTTAPNTPTKTESE
jgi:competence protein ComEC